MEKNGEVEPRIKISETLAKITLPHFKKVYRLYSRDSGKAMADYICLHDETVDDTKPLCIFDPDATWKRKTLRSYTARELLVPVFENGELVYDQPALPAIRDYCAAQLDTLWDEVKRFENPHHYYVDLSEKLWNIRDGLLRAGGR